MGTINRKIAHDIIHTTKYDSDNCTKIVTYNNMFDGGLTFAAVFKREDQMKYERSPACNNVRIVWENSYGYTPYGRELMKCRYQLQMRHEDGTIATIDSDFPVKILVLFNTLISRGFRGRVIDTHDDGHIIYNSESSDKWSPRTANHPT